MAKIQSWLANRVNDLHCYDNLSGPAYVTLGRAPEPRQFIISFAFTGKSQSTDVGTGSALLSSLQTPAVPLPHP